MSTSASKPVSPLAIAIAVAALVVVIGGLWFRYGRAPQPDIEHVVMPEGIRPNAPLAKTQ